MLLLFQGTIFSPDKCPEKKEGKRSYPGNMIFDGNFIPGITKTFVHIFNIGVCFSIAFSDGDVAKVRYIYVGELIN